jgi:hypothetical protein
MRDVTLLLVALLLPVMLLGLMLLMERVERPLRVDSVSDQLESFLDSARPEEVETYVSEGFAPGPGAVLATPPAVEPAARSSALGPS